MDLKECRWRVRSSSVLSLSCDIRNVTWFIWSLRVCKAVLKMVLNSLPRSFCNFCKIFFLMIWFGWVGAVLFVFSKSELNFQRSRQYRRLLGLKGGGSTSSIPTSAQRNISSIEELAVRAMMMMCCSGVSWLRMYWQSS